MFVTCQNVSQNLHFGKYVRWSCLLLVCLLLAKIYILASMFVGRACLFVTCQNLHFGNQNLHFGKYVRWSCLFVCLFVCREISHNFKNESANHPQTLP